MTVKNPRSCPICGEVFPARGLLSHLRNSHRLPAEEARRVFHGGDPRPDEEAKTLDLVRRLMEIDARLDALMRSAPAMPASAIAIALGEWTLEKGAIIGEMQKLYPDEPKGMPSRAELAEMEAADPDDITRAAAMGGLTRLKRQDLREPSKPWIGDEQEARDLGPARHLGYVAAKQLDLDRWEFELTEEGRRVWEIIP